MANRKYMVTLTKEEREYLEKMIQKGKVSGYKMRHAGILLKLDEIPENREWTGKTIAKAHNTNENSVTYAFNLLQTAEHGVADFQKNNPMGGAFTERLLAIPDVTSVKAFEGIDIVYGYKDITEPNSAAPFNKHDTGKYKKKWIRTGLTVKGNNKRKAGEITQKAAQEFEIELQNKALWLEAPAEAMTMAGLIREWLPLKKLDLRENTYAAYEDTASIHVLPYFDSLEVTVADVSPAHIQRYYAEKSQNGIGSGTLTRHRTIIRSSLDYAVQTLGILKANPADRVKLPKLKKRLPSFYTGEQLKRLFKAAEGESIETPVKLSAYLGLRRSEALALRWSSIDWTRKTVSITHTLVRVRTKTEFKDTVKQMASYRTMPLMPDLEKFLRKVQAHQRQLKKVCGRDFNADDFICIWDDGRLLEPDYVTGRFNRFLKEKELPHIRYHDLRHSSASLLINNGCTLKEVQEWLGQASSKSTEIYAHMLYESKNEMAAKVNAALSL